MSYAENTIDRIDQHLASLPPDDAMTAGILLNLCYTHDSWLKGSNMQVLQDLSED